MYQTAPFDKRVGASLCSFWQGHRSYSCGGEGRINATIAQAMVGSVKNWVLNYLSCCDRDLWRMMGFPYGGNQNLIPE